MDEEEEEEEEEEETERKKTGKSKTVLFTWRIDSAERYACFVDRIWNSILCEYRGEAHELVH